jgi:protein-export membrane protein SecD
MPFSWWKRFSFFLTVVALSIVYVIPTVLNLDLEKTAFPLKQKMNLGLDLQGGIYLVLGIDFNRIFLDSLKKQTAHLPEKLAEKLSHELTGKSLSFHQKDPQDPLVEIACEKSDQEKVIQILKKDFPTLRVAYQTAHHLELGLALDFIKNIQEKTVNQSIEVIRSRIDEFGVAEPIISSQGHDRVVVELPGLKDIGRAKELIGRTAHLDFKLVDDQSMSSEKLKELIQSVSLDTEKMPFAEYVSKINLLLKKEIPEGKEIAFEVSKKNDLSQRHVYLLEKNAVVTGSDLVDASVQFDSNNNQPLVSFAFNSKGALSFAQATEENIGSRLAIVLDNAVYSAPSINTKIADGKGIITLGSTADPDALMKEARDLAIVLRAGALPAQLDFLEQRVIGPSLGQDSIKKSAVASLVGSVFVFLFVLFYYRLSGLIAVLSLIFNVLFVLALLVALEATLTLPGIAGIALTVGIAVDSNVVIYERIREELRSGKRVFNAVHTGFDKAFRTILDANITNAIAGIVLMLNGTGPIRGFAVTLLVGIVTTLFTSVFVCRLFFDFYLEMLAKKRSQKISI